MFENAKEKLENSIIVIDESGNLDFKQQLSKYLKKRMNAKDKKLIKEIKMQKSYVNNLLQLADYVAGVINRSIQNNKRYTDEYRKIIAHREIFIQIWPK